MKPLELINAYLGVNCLVLAVSVLLSASRAIGNKLSPRVAYRGLLHMSYALALGALLLPFAVAWLDQRPSAPHIAEIWAAQTMHSDAFSGGITHHPAIVTTADRSTLSLSSLANIAQGLLAAGLLAMLAFICVDLRRASAIIARASLLRRQGRIRILASDDVSIPFSFWLPGRYYIVVPSPLLMRPTDLRFSIAHEAQHHRQGDTKLLYVCQLARGIFWWNPAAHAFIGQMRELQEFACDEAVLRRRRDEALDYCRCLLFIAEASHTRSRGLVSAAMTNGRSRVLKRRIEAALAATSIAGRKKEIALASVAAFGLLFALAAAIAAPIQDRRVTRTGAERMAQTVRMSSSFPIASNDRVLRQLNLLLGTPDGRAYLRGSLERMKVHEPAIIEQIARYGLPRELLAIPLVEAGYRNLSAGPSVRIGAGLWMFIESTARQFGLAVNDAEDERLNVPRETDAAMRMLSSLYAQFGDWNIAFLAYNVGHRRVAKGIRDTHSNDAWTLVEAGYENDPDYLARLHAAILIIENPATLAALDPNM